MSISDIPLRKKLALSLFSRYKAAEAKIHRLNYILWECTLRCILASAALYRLKRLSANFLRSGMSDILITSYLA